MHKYLKKQIKEEVNRCCHYFKSPTIVTSKNSSVTNYHLWDDKMLAIDHIKIPAAAVNGSQLVLLWKSDTMKTIKSPGRRRVQQTNQGENDLSKPREVLFQFVKIPSVFSLFLEADVKKVREQVK
jgi:hypothetical protein